MKKSLLIIIASMIFGLGLASPAQAQEKIDSFKVEIKLAEDASLRVTERIVYDFGTESKHGIYRDLPISYRNDYGSFNLRLSDLSVKDEKGEPYTFSAKKTGKNLRLQIGDAGSFIGGIKTYIIGYRADRAINFFTDHDELYWNVVGDAWTVGIEETEGRVLLPKAVESASLATECFRGAAGSTLRCESIAPDDAGGTAENISFQEGALAPGEGLTIAIGLPKGVLTQPSRTSAIFATAQDNWVIILPFFVIVLMTGLWYAFGRDPAGRGTIIAEYGVPDDLTPAELGTIIDERVDGRDLTAEIINLAVRGYLKILQIEDKVLLFKKENFELLKLKDPDETLNRFEKKLLMSLFRGGKKTVKLSELKKEFYQDMKEIKDWIYQSVTEKGYFRTNPQTSRVIYFILGIVIASLSPFFISQGLIIFVSLLASGIIIVIFSFYMPARTKKGALTREKILGLKEYLMIAEKDRLEFFNSPQAKPEVFEKFLPYAMALKVERQWAEKFADIYKEPPTWFTGPANANFSSMILINSLSDFSTKTNHVLAAAGANAAHGGSGIGGGGFSGGGFGGGGGGSW
jgi:uncharacterized membrane protein